MKLLRCAAASLLLPGCLVLDGLDGSYAVDEQTAGQCSGRWSAAYGGQAPESAGGIAVSSAPRLFVVGSYSGELAVGQQTLAANGIDSYLIALDNDGGLQQASTSGFAGNERAKRVAADTELVVLAGTYSDGFDGCAPADEPGDAGIFVSFVTAGTLVIQETRCLAGTGAPEITSIALDEQGVRIAGVFDGELVHEGTAHGANERDGFLVSFDRSGGAGLLLLATGDGDQSIDAVTVLPGGGTAIAGTFGDELLLLGESRLAAGGDDIFVAVLDPDLGLRTLSSWGTDEDQQVSGMAFEGEQLFLAGEHDGGALDFGGGAVLAAPEGEAAAGFAVSFPFDAESGALAAPLWLTAFAADDLDVAGIAASGAAVYLAGTVDGGLAVGAGVARGSGARDVFVVRLDRGTGQETAVSRCGDADVQTVVGVAVDVEDDDVFFVGELSGSIDLGGLGPRTSQGQTDILVGEMATPE
ncbi:MAG: hypothetical protein WKG00_04205 [Polyangiaceae bacterium]